jgi:hypothetical protein
MFTTLRVSATPVTAQMGSTPGDSAKPKTRVTVDPEVLNRKGQISPVLLRLRLRTDPHRHLRLRRVRRVLKTHCQNRQESSQGAHRRPTSSTSIIFSTTYRETMVDELEDQVRESFVDISWVPSRVG